MAKSFDEWSILKSKLDQIKKSPFFNEAEIWWCNIGLNIGSKMFGKGKTFTRPILVIRKFSKDSLLVLPLSTKIKDRFGYYKFIFQEKEICAVFSEIRKIDAKRLSSKIGEMSKGRFEELRKEIKKVIFDPF